MPSKRDITEGRLQDALDRLLGGRPKNTKSGGSITLNKINREAKLGNSYIHKFPEFVAKATPIIEEYNSQRANVFSGGVDVARVELSAEEKAKRDRLREKGLKEKYLQDSKDARAKYAMLETQNKQLMFRVFELQEKLNRYTVVPISEANNRK